MSWPDHFRRIFRRPSRFCGWGGHWALASLASVLAQPAASVSPDDSLPPRPASHIIDEIGALTPADSEQLAGLLTEAADRDDTHLYVVLVKKLPPGPLPDHHRELVTRWGGGWLTGVILYVAETGQPPAVRLTGPGEATIGVEALRQASGRVQGAAARETTAGAQAIRFSADLLDELRQLRLAAPAAPRPALPAAGTSPPPLPDSPSIRQWAAAHRLWLLAAPLVLGLLLMAVVAARRLPTGPLLFPDIEHRERLAAPYAGGSIGRVEFGKAGRRLG